MATVPSTSVTWRFSNRCSESRCGLSKGEGANAARKPIDKKRAEQGRERQVIAALRTIFDPALPVNICDLGLIYDLDVDAAGRVVIRMTLTAPGRPVAQTFPAQVSTAWRKSAV